MFQNTDRLFNKLRQIINVLLTAYCRIFFKYLNKSGKIYYICSPLVHLAMRTMQRFDICDFLHIDESVLHAWLHLMESNYHAQNPYHNSTHAADVMHATAYFLSCDRIKVSSSFIYSALRFPLFLPLDIQF